MGPDGRTPRDGAEERYLVLKGYAGLGNRLGALLQAIVYARLTGRRLVIDWNDYRYSADGTDIFRHLFERPAAGSLAAIASDGSVVPAIWRGHLSRPLQDMAAGRGLPRWVPFRLRRALDRVAVSFGRADLRTPGRMLERFSVDLGRLDHPERVAVIFEYTFRHDRLTAHAGAFPPEWRGLDDTALIRKLLADHVAPSPRIVAAVDEFRRRRFGPLAIGVHIRQTDNMLGNRVLTKGMLFSDFDAPLAEGTAAHPEATLFVSTDNRAVLEAVLARYPKAVSREKWYPDRPGEAIHGHKDCPDKLQMAEDALVDLYLLASCDRLICSSRTSFARFAQHLSRRPQQVVIDVTARGGEPRPFTAQG